MTTFQDPPPHSRRAVRQSERGENPDAQVNFAPFPGEHVTGEQPVAPAPNVDENSEPFAGPAPTGRRARVAAPDETPETGEAASTPPQPEPLTYATQGGATTATGTDQWAQPSPHAQSEQPYRVRDFSPEGRRSAGPAQQPQPWSTAPGPRISEVAAPLDYRTQAAPPIMHSQATAAQQTTPPEQDVTPDAQVTTPPAPAFLPPSAQPPQAPVHAVPVSGTPEPITMSRREMRALLAQQEAAAAQSSGEVPTLVEPAAAASASALSNAMAEFEALTRSARPAEPMQQPADATTPPEADPEAEAALAAADAVRAAQDDRARAEFAEREAADEARRVDEAEQQRALEQAQEEDSHAAAIAQAEIKAEQERQETARRAQEADTARAEELHAAALAAEAAAAAAPEDLVPQFVEPEVAAQPFSSAAGHWSRQGELDDETQPYENTLSREVGASNIATTTSALVLPVIPSPDFSTAIGNTGDILVTGSIDLPRSLGATGGDARRYDDPDVDNLFDAFDNEIINTDSAPVRAIRAVSTHTSTHGVLANAQPKTSRMLPILLVTTIVLAVAVVTVLVLAFVNGVF